MERNKHLVHVDFSVIFLLLFLEVLFIHIKKKGKVSLIGFSNDNEEKYVEERKSTTGFVFQFGGGIFS